MTRFARFKPGEVDHIKDAVGPEGQAVLECSICKSQFDPENPGRQHRMPRLHWMHTHAESKKDE